MKSKVLSSLGTALTLACVQSFAAAERAEVPGFNLVWHDEFDGAALDKSKWGYEVNARGGGNNELQYYITNNASVADGFLTITARKERYTGPEGTREYTSSRIRTKRKGDWTFGRIEMRAKLPEGKGIWPAFWMLPTDEKYGGWPHSGEIDIMELVGHEPHKTYGTLHYSNPQGKHTFRGTNYALPKGKFSDDFHVFRVDWEPGEFRWYLDDKLFLTQTNWPARAGAHPKPFDERFHIILNLATGGGWPGNPDETTKFPQTFVVDWVRVYQKKE